MALIDEVVERMDRDDLDNALEELEYQVEELRDVAEDPDRSPEDLPKAQAEVGRQIERVRVYVARVLESAS